MWRSIMRQGFWGIGALLCVAVAALSVLRGCTPAQRAASSPPATSGASSPATSGPSLPPATNARPAKKREARYYVSRALEHRLSEVRNDLKTPYVRVVFRVEEGPEVSRRLTWDGF